MAVLWRRKSTEAAGDTHVRRAAVARLDGETGPSMYYTFSAELWQYDGEAPLGFVTLPADLPKRHPSQARPVGHVRRIDQGNGHSWRCALGDIAVSRALAPLLCAPDPEVRPSGGATSGRFPCGGTARAALSAFLLGGYA